MRSIGGWTNAVGCGLVALLAMGIGCSAAPPPIVLVSLDTLRADHLSCYGYGRATSPQLDRFASEGVRFDNALAQASGTLPSHMSLFTSLYPPQFGITRRDGRNDTQTRTRLRLPERVLTLAETLGERGYRTAAFTDGGMVSKRHGLEQGFDTFKITQLGPTTYLDNFRKTVMVLDRFLAGVEDEERPFFLFVHTYDIHEPYSARPPFGRAFTAIDYATFQRTRKLQPRPQFLNRRLDDLAREDVELVRGLYDNGILATDETLGALFGVLRRHGLYEDALIVVFSDHGEEFMDHGRFGHGQTVYRELLRVPLVFHLPGGSGAGRVIPARVGLIDVAPTLLDYAGVPAPAQFEGRSLRPLLEDDAAGDDFDARPIYADDPDFQVRGLRRGSWAVVERLEDGTTELYDTSEDPAQRRDLSVAQPAVAQRLRDELRRWAGEMAETAGRRGTLAEPGSDGPAPGDLEALRALGYVDGTAGTPAP